MVDLLIKSGLICDGSGEKPFIGDVAVKDGKIVEVVPSGGSFAGSSAGSSAGALAGAEAAVVVDAAGLVVSPAFIDMHSHSDGSYIQDDKCESKIYQGVATEVTGQCGSSLFPRSREQMARLKEKGPDDKWDKAEYYQSADFEQLRGRVGAEGRRMSTNLVQLVGHNAIRCGVVGMSGRASTGEENEISARLLDQNLQQGAWGLSLGLGYMPGIFSEINELVALGNVCYKHNVVITSHMRSEGERLYEAIDEMIEINRRTGARVHIAHLKVANKHLWGTADRMYEHFQKARASGVAITMDMYPYNASSTGITNVLPDWAMEGGAEATTKRLVTPGEERDRLVAHLNERYPDKEAGNRVYVISTYGQYEPADDKKMGDLAEELGLSVPETLEKVLIATGCIADCIFFSMHEDDVMYLLTKDIAIGSDGSGRPYDPSMNYGKPHPRTYGTFPRFLRLRREKNLCPLETAIYRMTKKPAGIVGLKDRGALAPGYVADITIFDEAHLCDTATFSNPFQKPVGIKHVIMNGSFAIKDGEQTGERLGSYLLRV